MKTPLLLSVALLAFLMLTLSASNPKTYAIGDTAENFSLKSVKGDTVSLSDYQNESGVIVVFTCNHCPFAQLYEQRIIDLHRTFAPQGFPVVAINPNSPLIIPEDGFEKMQERARLKHYPFEYLFDEGQTVYPQFGATRTPHVFVLDANRVVRYIGAIDNNPEAPSASTQRWVENAVRALLNGEKPNPESTKSVGCTVKKGPQKKQ
ncbi:MAG: thioredoxin family protein [Saprospiraceae bacterium]